MISARPIAAALAALALYAAPALADAACGNSAAGFDSFIARVKAEAKAQGISQAGIAALDTVRYAPGIIKRDRAQSIFSQSFLQFAPRMATEARVKKGQALYQQYKDVFDKVQQRYGVPGPVLIAFWALETDFGGNMGNLPTLQSLGLPPPRQVPRAVARRPRPDRQGRSSRRRHERRLGRRNRSDPVPRQGI
jgi:membrane-bound lytic murein transglycosylase B